MTNKNVYNILVLAEGVNSNKLLLIGIDKINTDNEIKIEGRLAQLVERLPYKERVRSSSLLTPTIKRTMTFVIVLFILNVVDENEQGGALPSSNGFADGRHEVSPDSEQMELIGTKYRKRHSVSVEQIQDSLLTPN